MEKAKIYTDSLGRYVSGAYEIYIYGTAAALVFGKLFSRHSTRWPARWRRSPRSGAFSCPAFGWHFGHFGDKVGRRLRWLSRPC